MCQAVPSKSKCMPGFSTPSLLTVMTQTATSMPMTHWSTSAGDGGAAVIVLTACLVDIEANLTKPHQEQVMWLGLP